MWTTLHAQIVLCHLKLCLWLELWTVVLLCTLLSDVRLTCGICCSVISEHVLSHPCIVLRRQCQVSTSYKCKASASARRIWQTWGGGSYRYVQHPADCMALFSLLKTIKINGVVECRWYIKKSRFSTSIWLITAGWSYVITMWIVQYSL